MNAKARMVAIVASALACIAGCSGPEAGRTPASGAASSTVGTTDASRSSAPAASLPTAASVSAAPVSKFPSADAPPRAFDLHVDTPWQVKFKGRSIELAEGQASMGALKKGKYGGIVYPIYIADHLHDGHPTIDDADQILATVEQIVKHHDGLWAATRGKAPDQDKIIAYVSIEGAGAFASDITQIDRFIAKGVRLVGPVHMKDNLLSTSATGTDKKNGLSKLGKDFCERVYRAGALVDVSHISDRGFDDVAEIAKRFDAPIIATHSNARALAAHPRNLTDDQLRRIAATGGVAGVNFHGSYLKIGAEATMADAVKQTLHMVKVAGIDHVALGSDFDGATPPVDLADASYMPAFADALRREGLSAEDVHKIFSENAKRILAWKQAEPK